MIEKFTDKQASIPQRQSPAELCKFNKVMAANRGEIAIRILRAATELNVGTVAIYGIEDRHSPHRWNADQTFLLPESGTPVGCYLNIAAIIKIAKDNN
eukprot:13488601-Ditylum_brightwellii.AAC.1